MILKYKHMFLIILLSLAFSVFAQEDTKLKKPTAIIDPPGTTITSSEIKLKVSKSIFPIAIVGELRPTSFWQSLAVWETFVNGGDIKVAPEENNEERLRLINQMSSDAPSMILTLGNMVHYGSKEHHWEFFDNLVRPFQLKNIPVYAAMGEHEYWGRNGLAKKYAAQRFPIFRDKTWYMRVDDDICIIVLDSNEDELSSSAWKAQKRWFDQTLDSIENDPKVKGVIVFLHHPPFTNTKRDDSEHVKSAFLPAFISAKKTIAMISGGAATYERFDKFGKAFIVTGGGGAPRDALNWTTSSHKDEFRRFIPVDGQNKRPFNFLFINKMTDGVRITVKGLKKSRRAFFVMEEFRLRFPLLK